jgi:cell wall-associated NlpC family hydrolase
VPVTGLWAHPDAVRPLDAPLTDRQPRVTDWLAAQGPEQRRELWGRQDSQLLLGERVQVHGVDGGWARVVAPQQPSSRDARGYPGFVPAHHLRPAMRTPAQGRVVVHAPVTTIRDAPHGGRVMSDVSFATVLPVAEISRGAVAVLLPGGGVGWLPGADVDEVRSPAVLPTGEDLVAAGRQFLGVTYLAGGVHGAAFDCSGLIHAIYRRFGWIVPRDAHDQSSMGIDVAFDEANSGDLLFFTGSVGTTVHHVGLCLGMPSMLHASQADGGIIEAPLTERRRGHLFCVRRLRRDA